MIRNFDFKQTLDLGGEQGTVHIWEIETSKGKVRCGYTTGKPLIHFHSKVDTTGANTKAVLSMIGIQSPDSYLKNQPEHLDQVLIDTSDGDCDAIISTKSLPVILTPADCIGMIVIEQISGYFGIAHAGRSGISLNIAAKFLDKFAELSPSISSTSLKIFIAPHISPLSYPHENDNFTLTNDGKNNWWGNHMKFITYDQGKYYPDLGGAIKQQITDWSLKKFQTSTEIIETSIDTYTSTMASYKRDGTLDRNLVFVGYSH